MLLQKRDLGYEKVQGVQRRENDVTKLPMRAEGVARNCRDLLKRAEEFQSEEAHFAGRLLPQDLGHDRWSLARNKAGGGRPRGGDRQMHGLIRPENVGGGNAGALGADIESLGEFDELSARHIGSSKEDGNLQADAWRASS
jgi:hypothetical protein